MVRHSIVSGRLAVLLAVLAAGSSGCATSGARGTAGGDPNRIVRSELDRYPELSAYDAIQRLRNRWLTPRGSASPPAVIVDGTPYRGGLNELRQIFASQVEELDYLNAADATTRFGTGYDGGAILVSLRPAG